MPRGRCAARVALFSRALGGAGRDESWRSHAGHDAHAARAAAAAFALAARARRSFPRDAERLAAAADRADACPLGSGALAGCAFPLDREALARDLGFSRITANSLDAVSDRDFALEFLFALATLAMHLSRLAEDMILFASPEFGFVELPDEYSTGSSLMPQKKNPDAWELIRGKTGRIYGALCASDHVKGLPSSYQRDLQEDKEPVFAAHDQALAWSDRRGSARRHRVQRSASSRSRAGSRRWSRRNSPTIWLRRQFPSARRTKS